MLVNGRSTSSAHLLFYLSSMTVYALASAKDSVVFYEGNIRPELMFRLGYGGRFKYMTFLNLVKCTWESREYFNTKGCHKLTLDLFNLILKKFKALKKPHLV